MIIIADFGGQYNQLIARRVRDMNVYCEVVPYTKALEKAKELKPEGIIFTGGPNSVYLENAPKIEKEIYELGIPVLGLCYGMQIMAQTLGGKVVKGKEKEFGKTETKVDNSSKLFKDLEEDQITWMSHIDQVVELPDGFEKIAGTKNTEIAAMANVERKLYGMQYHPEVNHTEHGLKMLENFLFNICEAKPNWTMKNYAEKQLKEIKEKVGDKKVLLALSGGVDSSVVAALLSKAVGEQLTCIFVDHGLMRKNEGDEVEAAFKDSGMHFIRVDAEKRVLRKTKRRSRSRRKEKSNRRRIHKSIRRRRQEDRISRLLSTRNHLPRHHRIRNRGRSSNKKSPQRRRTTRLRRLQRNNRTTTHVI